MDLILRKRLGLNIYKRQSLTDRIRKKIVRLVFHAKIYFIRNAIEFNVMIGINGRYAKSVCTKKYISVVVGNLYCKLMLARRSGP